MFVTMFSSTQVRNAPLSLYAYNNHDQGNAASDDFV